LLSEAKAFPRGSLYGGRLRFDRRDPDRLYLVNRGNLLESRDNGRTWEDVGTDLAGAPWFSDVAVDPKQPGVLYAATPWGVYRLQRP